MNEVTQKTQRSNTVTSYIKAVEILSNGVTSMKNQSVLDYGAGLGKGSEVLTTVFGDVKTFEPFPQKGFEPTFTDPFLITGSFDVVVCLNVLNVLTDHQAIVAVVNIVSLLKDIGGKAVIGVRGWKNDVANTKTATLNHKEKEAHFSNGLIQRGYDGDDLINFIKFVTAGMDVRVKKINGLCGSAVMITTIGEEQILMDV
jgi:hypothetical protein